VLLTKLTDQDVIQLSLFDDCDPQMKPLQLMQIVDKLNSDYSQTHCTTLLGDKPTLADPRSVPLKSMDNTDELPIVKS